MRLPHPDKSGLAMTFRETGLINRTPTLGKIRKDIDSHFHGNDREGRGNDI